MTPEISIIMAAYNSEKYITFTIKSILNQSFRNFELLIVDDASTDETFRIIQSFSDKRILAHRNEQNVGLTKNLNYCIRKSKGKYIARIDSDDICDPNRLKIQYEYLESNPEVDVVGSDAYLIDENGKLVGVSREDHSDKDIKQKAIFMNPMIHPSVMLRASTLKNYMYDEHYRVCQDYDLWIRMVPKCKFHNIDKALVFYRLNKNGATRKARNDINQRIELLLPIVKRSAKNVGIMTNENSLRNILNLVLNNHEYTNKNQIITSYKEISRCIVGDKLDMSLVRFYKVQMIQYGMIKELLSGVQKWITYTLKQIQLKILSKRIQSEIDSIMME